MSEIKCNVETCRYNESRSRCSLSSIDVTNDHQATSGQAESKHDTQCGSFSVS
jgi:uncharacterized protein YccT (UPF0319 family)